MTSLPITFYPAHARETETRAFLSAGSPYTSHRRRFPGKRDIVLATDIYAALILLMATMLILTCILPRYSAGIFP